VVAAAATGAVVIALAIGLTLPSFVRFLRAGRWLDVWRPIGVALGFTAVTMVAGLAIAVWAHHLTPAQRNGGSGAYGTVAVVGGSLVVATIAAWTIAVLHAAASIDLAPRIVRRLGLLALVLSGATLVVLAGLVTWWAAVAADASWFLGGGRRGSHPMPLSALLVTAGLFVAAGAVLAVRGAWRVLSALRTEGRASFAA
jgi:hypothetical protein